MKLKFEKLCGRKSNLKREGGGKESKAIEQYTPLENSDSINWEKALPMTKYEGKAPPIILDNIEEVILDNIEEVGELEVCNSEIQLRDHPNLSVLTSYWDEKSEKWLEAERASHPFIAVKLTKINPKKNNSPDSDCSTLCLMADSGAMCNLLNHETVRSMGIDPESLDIAAVNITGVNGKRLESTTRQMFVKIENPKTKTESWEKLYVSPDMKTSLLSKDCLIRLRVIDPRQFLSEAAVKSFSVNSVDANKDKLTECEKSFFTKEDGSIGCTCEKRTTPPAFDRQFFEKAFTAISKQKGDLSEHCAEFLTERYRASSMNICQTQPLSVMKVPKMTVELKDRKTGTKAKRASECSQSHWQ